MQRYLTPGTPNMGVRLVKDEEEKLSQEDQALFPSGVGMLLFLVKHSRPDIANATRELSKGMSATNKAGLKELLRVIKYVIDTKSLGLKIEPRIEQSEHWRMVVFTDTDWAGDKDSRRSVSGYIIYLCGAPIAWHSKAQNHVTLSSSESEYVALSEAVKELKFIAMLLDSMKIGYQKPITVRVDNIGAIFMAENVNAMGRTRHIDVRHHFIRDHLDDLITLKFVTSDKNIADIFTKNTPSTTFDNHQSTMVGIRPDGGVLEKEEGYQEPCLFC